jgi:GT2 family glycosyltransferase/peptidoglycan/xylan/chitin deacetylase (PgdA/CDA1 family)
MADASVVIPSFNRSNAVTRLVKELAAQHADDLELEIIAVLDGSTDDSAARLSTLQIPDGVELRVIDQPNRGRAAARNAGIRAATGAAVIFLDDDVLPGPDLVRHHLRALDAADLVLGRIEHGESLQEVPAFREQSITFYRQRHDRLTAPEARILPTDVFAGNLSVRSKMLDGIGGFDESFSGYGCEDWDLGKRLIDLGARAVYCPAALVLHLSVVPYRKWIRNAREEAVSQLRLVRKHPSLLRLIDLGGLNEATLTGRLVSRLAIASPRLGRAAAMLAIGAGEAGYRLGRTRFSQRMFTQGFRLVFWGRVREASGSAGSTLRAFSLNCRALCYHRVHDSPNPGLAEWAVPVREFERQMAYLQKSRYQAISVSEMIRSFKAGTPLWKRVAITFDDGYADTESMAAPIMKANGFRGTLYAVTGLIGQSAVWDTPFGGEMAPLATTEAIKRLADAGWEIGHHTHSHPNLRLLEDDALAHEVCAGRGDLAALTGSPIDTFAYPYGEHDQRVRPCVEDAGYAGAVVLASRSASPRSHPFALERVAVLRHHSMLDFRLLLWFGLDRRELVRHAWAQLRAAVRPGARPRAQG